jgi:hypothetical protein
MGQLLRPIMRNPVYYVMYNIMSNWKTVVDEKYVDYCILERIRTDNLNAGGYVAYLVSYNSSTSFYLSSNSQYIVDRINSLFGHELVSRLLVKEIPTVVRPKHVGTSREECKNNETGDESSVAPGDEELLEKSLLELQKCL